MIVNSSDSIAQHDVFGPIVKKSTSNLADSIAQLDVFEENGSKKGSKMAPTLIKPMENHQTSLAGNISFCMKYFFCIYKKSVSNAET